MQKSIPAYVTLLSSVRPDVAPKWSARNAIPSAQNDIPLAQDAIPFAQDAIPSKHGATPSALRIPYHHPLNDGKYIT